MFYTYILRSLKDGRLYVGSTADLNRRLRRHNGGLVLATRHRRPLELVWHETHASRSDAARREAFLKSLKGSGEKARLISQARLPEGA